MIKGNFPKQLEPHHVIAICDTREQTPLDLSPLKTERRSLTTGDYSVVGLEHVIAVERKSLDDLVQCVTRERERFEREMHRIMAYPVKALVIEANWCDIELKRYHGKTSPNAIMGSLMSWVSRGIPVTMLGDHQRASVWTARLLYLSARHRWEENYSLLESIQAP